MNCQYIDCTDKATRERDGIALCTGHAARGKWGVCVLCCNDGKGLGGKCTCQAPERNPA